MSSKRRRRERPVSTGSIAFRIGLSSGLNLLLVFLVIDIALFCVFVLPALQDVPGSTEFTFDSYDALRQFAREWKIDILLRIEGFMVLLWVLMETLKVRVRLRPLRDMADAAMKLEDAIDMLSPADEEQKLATEILHSVMDFERMGDHRVKIYEVAEYNRNEKIEFSPVAKKELKILSSTKKLNTIKDKIRLNHA